MGGRERHRAIRAAALAGSGILAAGVTAGSSSSAAASELVVKNAKPRGAGSFRNVLAHASRNHRPDRITFASRLSGSIEVPGDEITVSGPVRIKARKGDPVLASEAGATFGFYGERASVDGLHTNGVGIKFRQDGKLKIRDSILAGRRIGVGVSVSGYNTVSVKRSEISGFGAGVSICCTSAAHIQDSTISGNTGRGFATTSYTASKISGSTISGNAGGGLYGGYEASIHVANSTISGNSADRAGGAIYAGEDDVPVTLVHTTVTDNSSVEGAGGISATGTGTDDDDRITLTNSIVAGNHSGAGEDDCAGRITSFGGNVLGAVAPCGGLPGDVIAGDPGLGPLADNGGLTFTHLPEPLSPAVDNGIERWRVDQRGYRVGKHETPDSGSVELSAKAP